MKRILTFISSMCFLLLSAYWGCKKDPVSSEVNDPRKLTWSAHTFEFGSIYDVWGSSAKDVYAVGNSPDNRGLMWHFDGKAWSEVKLTTSEGGGISGAIDLEEIYGFNSNDVWAVGFRIRNNPNPPPHFLDSSLLIHFDGSRWREVPTPSGRGLTTLWGNSSSDLWIAGLQGTLFHYDGVAVKRHPFPFFAISDPDTFYVPASIVGNTSGEAFMLVLDNALGGKGYFLLSLQNQKWVLEDSTFFWGSNHLWRSPEGTIYVTGPSVRKNQNAAWINILPGTIGVEAIGIHGTGDDNIFVSGRANSNAAIFHYNGSDWYDYPNLQSISALVYYDIWTDGRKVFAVGTQTDKSIVVQGK